MSRRSLLFKIVVLGESGVGKTSLLLRYVENKFTMATKSTIGSDFLSKEVDVDDKPVTLQIWDTAGQERFQGLGTSFYRGADGVVFVFDVTRRNTFEEIPAWKKAFLIQIGQENNDDFPILVLANKVDLPDRQVSKAEVKEYCAREGLPFFETSAKESLNVDRSFEKIASLILGQTKEEDMKFAAVDLNTGGNDDKCPC
jgi:Ras-related protein Rab-7A